MSTNILPNGTLTPQQKNELIDEALNSDEGIEGIEGIARACSDYIEDPVQREMRYRIVHLTLIQNRMYNRRLAKLKDRI